jgi:hypothetical protein
MVNITFSSNAKLRQNFFSKKDNCFVFNAHRPKKQKFYRKFWVSGLAVGGVHTSHSAVAGLLKRLSTRYKNRKIGIFHFLKIFFKI